MKSDQVTTAVMEISMELKLDLERPRTLIFDPPLSEAELLKLGRNDIRFEQDPHGVIHMLPGTGGLTSCANAEISGQLGQWAQQQRGMAFESSIGFRLPDGSLLSPDASYLAEERVQKLPEEDTFPQVCPNFVIELRSPTDSLATLQDKMAAWIRNGAELAWLIDLDYHIVYVYRSGVLPVFSIHPAQVSGDGPVAGFVLDLTPVWEIWG